MFLILKTPVAEEGNNTGVEIQQRKQKHSRRALDGAILRLLMLANLSECARTLVDARRFVLGVSSTC